MLVSTFAAPVVSFVANGNAVATSGGIVTLTGLNFRPTDLTATADLALQACLTATWASTTSVACHAFVGSSIGAANAIVVTASSVSGTRTSAFTFDGKTRNWISTFSIWSQQYHRSPRG